jgi:hypothetical protein
VRDLVGRLGALHYPEGLDLFDAAGQADHGVACVEMDG